MRGDRIANEEGWAADQWMSLPVDPGVSPRRVRFWIAEDEAERTYRLSASPVDGRTLGAEVQHQLPDGSWCGGYITDNAPLVDRWGITQSGHHIVSIAPLHIEASLACRRCPSHGWVRNGRWVDVPG